jgi:hypothetical protein
MTTTRPSDHENAIQSSSGLAACTCRMDGSAWLAAGSLVARAASGMAIVGRRPFSHVTES